MEMGEMIFGTAILQEAGLGLNLFCPVLPPFFSGEIDGLARIQPTILYALCLLRYRPPSKAAA
jgi:hypothetical protein